MQNRSIDIRTKCILAVVLTIVILFLYYLIIQTGIVPGANKDIDDKIAKFKQTEEAQQTVEGPIVDRNGDMITYAEEAGEPALCVHPEEYSALVGYNSKIYGTSGLRRTYAENLFVGGKDKVGATIKLTTDNKLQKLCYSLLGNNVGSIVVLDNNSAEVKAIVSRSNENTVFNVNEIDTQYQTYDSIEDFFYNRAVFAQDPPGSTFKIVTASALIENKLEDYVYNDNKGYGGIKNAGGAVYGETDLQKALVKSSNIYFASAGNMMGGVSLSETAQKFLMGEAIALDFTALTSNFDMEYYQDGLVAQTAFGQGKTKVSPLQIAMILQTIVNNGEMLKPYLVSEITDDGKVIYDGKKEVIARSVSKETAQKMRDYLSVVAEEYGFESDIYGTVYAKTGTAEVGENTYNHIYLVFANERITGIVSMDKSYNASKSLVGISKQILDYVENNL